MKKIRCILLPLCLVFSLVFTACLATAGIAESGSPSILIGLSQPTNQEARYIGNTTAQQKKADEIGGIEMIVTDANNDPATQATQIENMISKGVDVLIVCPCDNDAVVPSVEAAKAAGIPVVVWGRQANTSKQDVFINYDWTDIGRQMGAEAFRIVPAGRYVIIGGDNSTSIPTEMTTGIKASIQPGLDSGDIEVVFEQYITNWTSEGAMDAMENALTQLGNDIDMVICHNDGMAGGAIQALATQGLAGKIPVVAMDAELAALHRILEGTQHSTVQFDFNGEGEKIMSAAYALATGSSLDSIVTFTTPIDGADIPTADVPFFVVTKENMEAVVVDGGFKTYDEVFGQ